MDAIEEYFQGEYIQEKNKINEIDELVSEVIKSLTNSTPDKKKGWPYEISANTGIKQSDNYSFSTNAMILFVLAKFIGEIEIDSPLLPSIEWESNKSLSKQFAGFDISEYYKIFNNESKNLSTKFSNPKDKENQIVSKSGSFGFNDPFTFSWIAELLSKTYNTDYNPFKEIQSSFINESSKIIKDVFVNTFEKGILNFNSFVENGKTPEESQRKASNHIFPLLRVIHLYKSLCHIFTKIEEQKKSLIAQRSETKQGEVPLTDTTISAQMAELEELKNSLGSLNTTDLLTNLQNRINQQISHFTIQNSLFDTAELVMSLEGMLLLDENRRIDENLIRKVFEILETNQKNNLNWRPLKPFVTSPQGDVLLPLSIEIANSLLRICKLLERKKQFYFHEYAPIFNKYTQWLLANVSQCTVIDTVTSDTTTYKGWRSEHVQEADVIHPWETAQVLTYLMTYKSMIQERIAHKSLKNCGLSCSEEYLSAEGGIEDWDEKWKSTEIGTDVYSKIRNNYIIRKADPSYSMLLFGPPGTGKTAIGEDLAAALKWRLITITPSDFIKNGEADVEGRAKSIFKTLEQQKDCVILFDEIDRLILDRDSIYYNNQGDMFQFMTPSMLVKIKDLRKAEKCIFIIATNYAERIDSAIKRAGRIDEKYLINLPNKEQRKSIITRLLSKYINRTVINSISEVQNKEIFELNQKILKESTRDSKKDKEIRNNTANYLIKLPIGSSRAGDLLSEKSVLYAYGELETFVKYAARSIESVDGFLQNINKAFEKQDKPAVKLSNYERRFQKEKADNGEFETLKVYPYSEFFNLIVLVLENADKDINKLICSDIEDILGEYWKLFIRVLKLSNDLNMRNIIQNEKYVKIFSDIYDQRKELQ